MNAPFNPRGAALREPFAAFVQDDATTATLTAVAGELGWPVERITRGGLRAAVQSLSVSASPQILFVDLSESGDPLGDINGLAEVCEPGTVVIATGHVNDVRLYRDLVGSGIQDYLLKPVAADHLRDALAQAQMTIAGPRSADAGEERPHLMAAFVGVRGGIGASTLASSVAWLLGDREKRSTALLDLDVHFGTGALSLDLEPGRGLTDAIDNPSRIDGLFLERALVSAGEHLAILSAEASINSPLLNDGSAFSALQEELRAAFECTVIDLPRYQLVLHPHLLQQLQAVVLVTEFTLAATRDTIRILSWLKTTAPQARVLVVANKVPAGGTEIRRKDFETSVERRVDVVIAADPKLAQQAAKLGKPLAEVGKTGKTATGIAMLASRLMAAVEDEEGAARPAAQSLLARLGQLRVALPARRKAG